MLQIIKGPAKSGKTEYLLSKVRELCGLGVPSTIVVSQQVSFEYERLLLKRFSPSERSLISVKSFEALARDIFKQYGGAAVARLSNSGKRAAVRRAVDQLGDMLMFFRRHRNSEAFYDLVCRAINEFSLSGIKPDRLLSLASGLPSAADRAKLSETAEIYAAYLSIIEGSYNDVQGAVESAARTAGAEFFEGRFFLLDEFDSFTYPQEMMIDRMLELSPGVLCALDLTERDSDIFITTARTERRLMARATERGAAIDPPVVLCSSRSAPGIAALGDYLLYNTPPESIDGVFFCRPRNIYDELRTAAAAIASLIRSGRSYSDIAVLVSDADKYKQPLETEFSRYGLPCFSDFDGGIAASPCVRAAAALLELADEKKPQSELLLTILKTGVTQLPAEDVMLLSNYVFIWGIDGDDWLFPFDLNPSGLKNTFSPADSEQLARIEAARSFIIDAVEDFLYTATGDGDVIISALYSVLTRLGCDSTIKELCQKSDPISARRVAREYQLFIKILENMHTLLLGDNIGPRDIAGLISTEAAAARLYDVPETICEITVGEACRARPFTRPILFVLGLVSGELPRNISDGGLLTERDRELLSSLGAELQNSFESRFYGDRLRLYRALTTPAEMLFMSAPQSSLRGASLPLSDMIVDYTELYLPPEFKLPKTAPLAADPKSALSLLPLFTPAEQRGILRALSAPGLELSTADRLSLDIIDLEALNNSLGPDLMLSPSRAECYSRCSFMYFMRYIMGAEPILAAKLDYREVGNMLHHLLEHIMRESGAEFTSLSTDQLLAATEKAGNEYIKVLTGGRISDRMDYLKGRLTEQAVRLLMSIQKEQLETKYQAVDFELSIRRGGDVPPRELPLPGGGSVRIEGKVDRVDVMFDGRRSLIRVVDYKTGSKKFSLSDVYYGISVQMFIYLYSICQNGGQHYTRPVPAGVMFMNSEPNLYADSADKAYMMDGIIVNSDDVLDGMRSEQGRYIPAFLDSNGKVKSSAVLASAEKLAKIFKHIDSLLVEIGSEIRGGRFAPDPLIIGDKDPCTSCNYRSVCRSSDKCGRRRADPNIPEAKFEVGGDDNAG